ncbi:uncharacterized [Tachysurus ichikawai]
MVLKIKENLVFFCENEYSALGSDHMSTRDSRKVTPEFSGEAGTSDTDLHQTQETQVDRLHVVFITTHFSAVPPP